MTEPEVLDRRRDRRSVWTATVMFAAVCLGMLVLYRPFLAPDEIFQFDRIYAASHGDMILAPGEINLVEASSAAEQRYVQSYQRAGEPSIEAIGPVPRDQRPSMAELGGNGDHHVEGARSNYMTQHPPLYYAVMGLLKNQIPDSENIPVDQLVFWLRAFNVLMLLPLPYLAFAGARRLGATGPLARAAAFTPLLIPGLARSAAGLNNDNLAILAGSVLILLLLRVIQGDATRRTALLVGLTALAGALTKGTMLPLIVFVPIAYALLWWRRRSLPPTPTLVTLVVSGLAVSFWSLKNRVYYGTIQPNLGIENIPRREPGSFRFGAWLDEVWALLPARFWGNLGLLEPPALPRWLILGLTVLVLLAIAVAVWAFRGARLDLLFLAALPVGLIALVLFKALRISQELVAIPGLQGRYAYPAVLGLLLPAVLGLGFLLRRQVRFAPVAVALAGLLVTAAAVKNIVGWYWLPSGQSLGPGNLGDAFRWIRTFGTWPPVVTAGLCGLVVLALLGGLGLLVRDLIGTSAGPPATLPSHPRVAKGVTVDERGAVVEADPVVEVAPDTSAPPMPQGVSA